MTEDIRASLSSLRRGLNVLAFLNKQDTVTTAEIARQLALPRTTAQRIVTTLIKEGYVERVPMSSLYRLTPAVNTLSGGFNDESWVSHVASPLLFSKTKEINWPLALATPFGEDMILRVSTDLATSRALDHFKIGFRTPIMFSTGGRVILAFSSDSYRKSLLDLMRKSDNPLQADVHNESLVEHIIDRIRTQGYEHKVYPDFPEASIAVPIFVAGSVKASLLVLYIKRAFSPAAAVDNFVPMLQELARQIEDEVAAAKRRLIDIQQVETNVRDAGETSTNASFAEGGTAQTL